MKFKIRFSSKTIAAMILSVWLGIHFTLPIEYWVLSFFVYVGITIEKK